MTRFALLLLLGTPFAVAAPVPKDKERQKIEKLFGLIVDPMGDSRFKRSGAELSITLPANKTRMCQREVASIDDHPDLRSAPRLVREVGGDFVTTVRVHAPIAADDGPAADGRQVLLAGGIHLLDDKLEPVVRFDFRQIPERDGDGVPKVTAYWGYRDRGGIGAGSDKALRKSVVDHSLFLRVTRRGADFAFDTSYDGKKWVERVEMSGQLAGDCQIALTAQHASAKAHTVTFSEFEVKPVEKK